MQESMLVEGASMVGITRLAVLFSLASALGFAASYSGELVNSRCMRSQTSNTKENGLTFIDLDRGSEIEYCAPNRKTKTFALVLDDGQILNLDAAGNEKASLLVQQPGNRKFYSVQLTGTVMRRTIRVDSLSGREPGAAR